MLTTLTIFLLFACVVRVAAANTSQPRLALRTSEAIVSVWRCEDQLGRDRTKARSPWKPHSAGFRRAELNRWVLRRRACLTELHRVAAVNANLIRLAICETGGINGGQPLWTHHNSVYSGALGFAHSTWTQFKPDGYPQYAAQATPGQQLTVGRILVARFGGYSPWPACHRRLGLPG